MPFITPLFNKKTVAAFLVLTLLGMDLSAGGRPVYAAVPAAETSFMPVDLRHLDVPEAFGSVEDLQTFDHSPYPVVILQDAHAVPAAQKSLFLLTDWLIREKGADVVKLEGAASSLDPLLLKSFPDIDLLRQVLMTYLDLGEISGVAAASVIANTNSSFDGMEDPQLYTAAVNAYLEAVNLQPEGERLLKEFRQLLEADTVRGSRELREAVSLMAGEKLFIEQLQSVSKFVTPAFRERFEKRFRDVFLLLDPLKDLDVTREKLKSEVRSLAETFETEQGLDEQDRKQAALWKQQFSTESLSAEDYAAKLIELAVKRGAALRVSDTLLTAVNTKKHFDKLKVTGFAREWKDFQEVLLTGALSAEPELFQAWKFFFLLQKWQRLELTSDDLREWNQFSLKAGALEIQNPWLARIADLRKSFGPDNPWDRFYQLASARDQAFAAVFNHLEKQKKRPRLVILSAGGFHTEGVEKFLSERGISYARVLPAVSEVPETDLYSSYMGGGTSWRQYYRKSAGEVPVYDAFQQSAADRFADSLKEDPVHFSEIFRLWREQVLRALAQAGRLAESADYTVFIDRARFATLPESEKNSYTKRWNRTLGRFLDQLRSLSKQNLLNGESLMTLPRRSGVVQWPAVMSFVKGSHVPAEWAEGKPQPFAFSDGRRSFTAEKASFRAELRDEDEDDNLERLKASEIIYDDPLEQSWKIFWFLGKIVFFAAFGTAWFWTPGATWIDAFKTAVFIAAVYFLGAGSALLNYERKLLKDLLRKKMIPAPRFSTFRVSANLKQTMIEVPELFQPEPGERFPVEKFVNTALHALELIPSQIVRITIGTQTVYERGEDEPSLSEILSSAQQFDFGKRPDYAGPISLRLSILHGPAVRSELRDEVPVLTAEESLRRFQNMQPALSALITPLDEKEDERRALNEALHDALQGLVYRDGYQLVWNQLDYFIVRREDQRVVGNISLYFVFRDKRLAAEIGYEVFDDQGQGLISDFHTFLAKAFPRELPLTSGIDNIPTLRHLLDLMKQDGFSFLTPEQRAQLQDLEASAPEASISDFRMQPSIQWRSAASNFLGGIYRQFPFLIPGPRDFAETQLGHLNRYYGGAETSLLMTEDGILDFLASRITTSLSLAFPKALTVREGLLDFRAKMEALIDSAPFNPARKPSEPDSYGSFIKSFAAESGIKVAEKPYLSFFEFYRAQWESLVSNFKALFKDAFRGKISRLPGHFFLGTVSFFNLIWMGLGVPAIALDDKDGKLQQLIFVNKMHFYFPGIAFSSAAYEIAHKALNGPVGKIEVLNALIGGLFFYLAASLWGFFFNLFSRGFSGHEMTHVFQFSLMERVRTELDLPLSFMQIYEEYFTRADLEAPPMPSITRSPPTPEQLKQQIRMILSKFLERSEELEANRAAAREAQDKWESEKRVNAPDTFHKVQILLNDVQEGLRKGVLETVVLTDASGHAKFLNAGETPELAVSVSQVLQEMRRGGGYSYAWSLGHKRLSITQASPRTGQRSELRSEDEGDLTFLETQEELRRGMQTRSRYNNGVQSAFFNRAISLLKRARRDQHAPDADLLSLEDAEFKIQVALRLMKRVRGRTVLPAYLHRRAILERNLNNLLAANYLRRAVLFHARYDRESTRMFLDKASLQLDVLETSGHADAITKRTRARLLRQRALFGVQTADEDRTSGRYETALILYQNALRGFDSSLALYRAGEFQEDGAGQAELARVQREKSEASDASVQTKRLLRQSIRGTGVEFRLMGSDLTRTEPYFLAGTDAPYPVLSRGQRMDLFNHWAFFDRYADEEGTLLWDEDNDVFIAYLGGEPAAAWAFQADRVNWSLQANGLYVNPVLRGSGLATLLARRLFQMLKTQGFKKFQIGPLNNRTSWGIEKTPEAQAFHRSLIRWLGKEAVSARVFYADGQLQGLTVNLEKLPRRSELRAEAAGKPALPDPWTLFWKEPGHATSFSEGRLERSYYEDELVPVFDGLVESLPADGRVLDLAAGNGAASLALLRASEKTGKKISVVSADQADVSVPFSPGQKSLTAVKVKAEELPFEDQTFDAVTSFFGVEFTDRERSLPEVFRVLSRGGRAVFLVYAAESPLISFYKDYVPLFESALRPLLEAGRAYAENPGTVQAELWLDAMGVFFESMRTLDPKPRPLRIATQMVTELDQLLNRRDENTGVLSDARGVLFTEYEKNTLNEIERMRDSARAALPSVSARQLVRDLEKIGFEDVYVQPFQFNGQLLGWAFFAAKPHNPSAANTGLAEPSEDDRRPPPLYVLHEIGNLISGFQHAETLLDPKGEGKLEVYYGKEFYQKFVQLQRHYDLLRNSFFPDLGRRVEELMRDISILFEDKEVAAVVEHILESGHPSGQNAATRFETSARWLHQLVSAFLNGKGAPLQNIRPYMLIRDALQGYGDAVYYAGTISSMNLRAVTYPLDLYQVLVNLTRNAVHATDEHVTGRPRKVELSVEALDPLQNDGFSVRIQVRDNGTGIAPDILPRIFEPHFTTKGAEGKGVGLDVVKSTVETVLGGKLTVETKEGEGTVFSVYLPDSAPARSELRQDSDSSGITRRQMLSRAGYSAAFFSLLLSGSPVLAQKKDSPAPRKVTLPANPHFKNPLFRELYRDTQNSLLQMRTPQGFPYNQAVNPLRPANGWMKSSDLGFMWLSDVIGALGHGSVPIVDRIQLSTPAAVTKRIKDSLAEYKKLVETYGLKMNGVNTGILPEVLIHERTGFKVETVKIPGRMEEKGIPFAAYDMALTHARLKIVAEVFKGGYVRGLEDAGIVKAAQEILDQADYRVFLDSDGKIRNQVFQKPGDRDAVLGPALIDNRHTEARDFFLIPEVFGKPGVELKDRRKEGLKVLAKLKLEWVIIPGQGGEGVAVGRGDENLTAWTEYEGLQFLDPTDVSPQVLKVSARNYFEAAAEKARELKHEFAVTAPGSGTKPEVYEPYGLKKPDVLVPAGTFLALNSDLPDSVLNAEKLIRAAKRQRSYQPGWGLADAYDPKTGRAYHAKRLLMNQGLIVESLAAPLLRAVTAQMDGYSELKADYAEFDKTHKAPAAVKNLDVLKLFEGTGFFTQAADHPSNREFVTEKGALRIWYRLDDKNAFSGFVGKMKTQDFTAYKTLKLTFSKDSVLPEVFRLELKDDSPEKKLIGGIEIKGAKPGASIEVDISELTRGAAKVSEFLLVFDKTMSGKNPVGLFDLEEIILKPLAVKGRSELRDVMMADPDSERYDRGFFKKMDEDDELLQLVDGTSGRFLNVPGKAKSLVHRQGDWHAVTQVYIFDSSGKLLLQERSLTKDLSPGKLQVSAGGHVNVFESRLDAALRETREELGLVMDTARLTPLSDPQGQGFPRTSVQGELVNREWVSAYMYVLSDDEKSSLDLNHEEVTAAYFVTMPFFRKVAQERADLLSGSLQMLVTEKQDMMDKMIQVVSAGIIRSELRDNTQVPSQPVIESVLRAVAVEKPLDAWNAAALARLVQSDREGTFRAMEEAGRDDIYPGLIAGEALFSARENAQVIETEVPLNPAVGRFIRGLLDQLEKEASSALAAHQDKKMTFAFGYRLPADSERRELLLSFFQVLARLRTAFPSQVTADIRLLILPHEAKDASVREFFQQAGSLGVAKPVEMSSGQMASVMAGYLSEFGSALVYGLSDSTFLDGYAPRAVLSEVAAGEELPVVIVLSKLMAFDGKIKMTAERLGRLAQFLPGILKMQGTHLYITRLVLEIAERFQADRLIQEAA